MIGKHSADPCILRSVLVRVGDYVHCRPETMFDEEENLGESEPFKFRHIVFVCEYVKLDTLHEQICDFVRLVARWEHTHVVALVIQPVNE